MLKLLLLNLILFIVPDLCFTRTLIKSGIVRIPLTNWNNMELYTAISIGTEEDSTDYLNVLLDTGSSEFWVPSSDCDQGMAWCRQHHRYNHTDSLSYVNPHRNFTSSIRSAADNSISGRVSIDKMEAGDVILQNMEFGEAITSSSDLTYSTYDGVLGLGPKKVSTVGTTFLQRLLQSGIDDAVFSFVLGPGESGSLVVGGVDHDKYTGSVVWSRIISEDKWLIKSDSISIGTKPLCNTNCHIEFNTELEIIIGPRLQIAELYKLLDAKEVPGVTIRTVDCDKVSHFPDLTFTVKGHKLSMAPQDYVLKYAIGSQEYCYLLITSVASDVDSWAETDGDSWAETDVDSWAETDVDSWAETDGDSWVETDGDSWVFGTAAHKPLYVVYDFGRSQVGLAQAV